MTFKLGTANPLGPWLRAFNPFNNNGGIVGAVEADTEAMTVTVSTGAGQFASSQVKHMNFFLRVADDAPDDFKRVYLPFVHPNFRPVPA